MTLDELTKAGATDAPEDAPKGMTLEQLTAAGAVDAPESKAPAPDGLKRTPDGMVGPDPAQFGAEAEHPTLAAIGNTVLHPVDTLTDPSKRRELERGVGNAATFGLANYVAGKADPSFAASAAPDAAAAPGYRRAGEAGGMLLTNPVGAAAGKLVGGAIRAPAAAAADAVTAPAGALSTGGKIAKGAAHAIAHTVLDTIPHVAAHALGGGSIGHSLATAADIAIEAAHLPQKAAGAMLTLVAKAHTEGWTSGKLAQAIIKLSSKATQAAGTEAAQ